MYVCMYVQWETPEEFMHVFIYSYSNPEFQHNLSILGKGATKLYAVRLTIYLLVALYMHAYIHIYIHRYIDTHIDM